MDNPKNSYNFDSEELEILKAFESGKLNGSVIYRLQHNV